MGVNDPFKMKAKDNFEEANSSVVRVLSTKLQPMTAELGLSDKAVIFSSAPSI